MNPNGRSLTGDFVLVLPSGCHVDNVKKLAYVEAGSLWQHVDWELSLYGRCIPAPIVQSIGVAGSTLGGGKRRPCPPVSGGPHLTWALGEGWGYVSKEHGMSCDSVVEAEIVTADARVLRLSRDSNRDLLWAVMRGAGAGTLGVVTRLTFKTYEAPVSVYHGALDAHATLVARISHVACRFDRVAHEAA